MKRIVAFLVCGWLLSSCAGEPSAKVAPQRLELPPDNYFANGDFERGLIPCHGIKVDRSASPGIVDAPELVSHERVDANGSAGALRIRIEPQPRFEYTSDGAGASCPWRQPLPAGTRVRVEFSAKSLRGDAWLSLSRPLGGSYANVKLSTRWERHVTYLNLQHGADGLVFGIVAADLLRQQPLARGEVLLDDLYVRPASDVEAGPAPAPPALAKPIARMDEAPAWQPYTVEQLREQRAKFSWQSTPSLPPTAPIDVPRRADEMPKVYYVQVYVRSANELRELDELGVHHDLVPLFDQEWPDAGQDTSLSLPFSGDPLDGGGQFAFALMTAEVYNGIRDAALGLSGEAPVETYAAMMLRPVPAEARAAGHPSEVRWDYLLASGMQSFAPPAVEYTDAGPMVPPLLEDLPNTAPVDKAIGRRLRRWVRKVADRGRRALDAIRAGFGAIADVITPDARLTFRIQVPNRSLGFVPGDVQRRAWDFGGTYDQELTLRGAGVQVMGRGRLALYPAQLDDGGAASLVVAPRIQTRICVVADAPAARMEQGLVRPARQCFGWFRPERGAPPSNTRSYRATEYEFAALAQFTDAREYARRVLGFVPRKAAVLTGKLTSFTQLIPKEPAFVPCLAANRVAVPVVDAAAAALDAAGLSIGFLGLPPIPLGTITEFVLANDVVLPHVHSRFIATHEYGHFLFCDLLARENPASFALVWSQVIANIVRPTAEVNDLNEGFADWFASQVVGATGTFELGGGIARRIAERYYLSVATSVGVGLEANMGGVACANASPSSVPCPLLSEPASLGRAAVATVLHDAVDCTIRDGMCALEGRTNGGSYENDGSALPTFRLVRDPVLSSINDELVELTPRQILEAVRSFARRGVRLTRQSFYAELSAQMAESGLTGEQICLLYRLHTSDGTCPPSWLGPVSPGQ